MDSVLRIIRKNNFTAVNNDFIRDEKLSWKAKGIIIYVMSLPEGWKLHLAELSKHSKDGRDSTNNGIRELIENGYCSRRELRDSRGMFAGYEYTISDVRDFAPQTENPHTDNPQTENPHTDNPPLINTDDNKTLSLTDTSKEEGVLFGSDGDFKPVVVTAPGKRGRKSKEKIPFEETEYFGNPKKFCERLAETGEFPSNTNYQHYYFSAMDWSAKGGRYAEWVAGVRNWIRSDVQKGQLAVMKGGALSSDAMDYLKGMAEI